MGQGWKPDPVAGQWACAKLSCHWQGPEAATLAVKGDGIPRCPLCVSPDVFPSDDGGWEEEDKPNPHGDGWW